MWGQKSFLHTVDQAARSDFLSVLRLYVKLKEDVYSRVTAAAVLPKMERGREKREEERKGMHSWWISHFGLWPGSHPITFKLAAACKTLHISHRVLHPL